MSGKSTSVDDAKSEDKKVLDTTKYEDFLFEVNDFMSSSNVLTTNMENCVKFEMTSDEKEKIVLYANIQMEDIQTLVRENADAF